jgi:hypothetical protein
MPRTRSGVDAGFPSEIAQPNDLFCLFLVMYPTICRQNPGPRKNGCGEHSDPGGDAGAGIVRTAIEG